MSRDLVSRYLAHHTQSLQFSPAKKIGALLAKELADNPHFYFFSPDETTSNKFDAIFNQSARAWNLPTEPWDLPESPDGQIVEMLSENVLFSVMAGHLLNQEPAMMGSYESFFTVITSQLLQQIKFFKQCSQVDWRPDYPSVNLLSTSTCWRQDHNGFTHQSPALISTLLFHPAKLANCLFPVDDIAAETAFHFMLGSNNLVNLTTFNKIDQPRYLTKEEADFQLNHNYGVHVFQQFSDQDPDFILVASGDIMTRELIAARKILKQDFPDIKLRLINIAALSYRAIGLQHQPLSKQQFEQLFTQNKPIIANFHGYPETFENILENYTTRQRLRVHGFIEEGSTTTPFEMLRRNATSRYDLAIDVATALHRQDIVEQYQRILADNHQHAIEFGEDMLK